jgi:potassium-dependent mechanosensitive channel
MRTLRITRTAGAACLLAASALFFPQFAHAQSPSSSAIDTAAISATPTLTAAGIKSKIDEIAARKDIAPAVRDQTLALYRDALSQLEAAASSSATAAKFQEAIQSSPKRTAELKQLLAETLAPPKTSGGTPKKSISQLPLADIEQNLDTIQAEMATLRTQLGDLDVTLRALATRPTAAREEQSAEKQRLDQLASARPLANLVEDPVIADARRAAVLAELLARAAKINQLEQEVISLPARQALATSSRDLTAAKLERLQQQVPPLEARINDLRQGDAFKKQAQAEQVTRQLSGQSPLLEDYAKTTAQLLQKQTDLALATEQDQTTQTAISAEIARMRESMTAAQQILEIGTVGEELGEFLREMRAQLPVVASLRDKIHDRDAAIVDTRLQRLNVDKTRRALADAGHTAELLLEKSTAENRAELQETLQKLVSERADALARLGEAYTRRIDDLAKINAAERELLSQTTQLESLLNDRLLWLPSSAPLGAAWLEQVEGSVDWMTSRASSRGVWNTLVHRIQSLPLVSSGVFLLGAVLWGFRRRLRRRLDSIATAVGRPTTDGYSLTPRALAITALIALHWPLLLGYVGWLLRTAPEASEFTACVGNGMLRASFVILLLRFLQLLCLDRGLFHAHFEWSGRACQLLAGNLSWLVVVVAPANFLIGMIELSKSQVYRDGLGRLAFIAGSIAIAVFAMRIFSPRRGIFVGLLAHDGVLWLTRSLWYPLVWAAPLALAALAVSGYYDSAALLQAKLLETVAIGVLGLITYGVAMRQLLVARRRLEMQRAYDRREKVRAAAAAREAVEASGDATPQVTDILQVDVASISLQTRTLLRMLALVGLAVALWIVWRPLVPALGVLDDVALWTQTVPTDAGTRIVPVSLSNLLLALAIAAITFVASHNLPGLLEILLLQRLSIEPGTRYAITAISRYSIIAFGLLIAFNRVGADWSQLQWIVAALGVGVGFGLQEIVANFVSGLIILFERPVRVGDTVTIGDVSGTVSRIQIRATSITDWDNREVLVPNKALITDKVTNWTLSDRVTRLFVPVGIAYGSDTVLAQEIMLDAVKANPLVLEQPAPTVFFLGFGDSALNYEVRAFVAAPAHRLPVLHELHIAIERTLREHSIQIPFPQRDLHMKFEDVAEAVQVAGVRALRQNLKEAG